MTSPFLTTNIFIINLVVMLLTTSITGGIVTLVWLAVGKLLEKMGFINIVFELMKLASFFFICPVSYIFLKVFEMEVGSGYLFSPTEMILVCAKIFLLFWSVGCACILCYMIFNIRILRNHYKDAFLCETNKQNIYACEVAKMGLRKNPPPLMQSYYAKVPCLKGVFKQIILLPVKEYSEEELRVIFAHELTHYKQKDVLLKACILLLVAMHFYNPLIWVLASKIHKWSEYACDYRACKAVGGMKHYFEVIMNMSVKLPTHFELSSQLVENQHELVGRVKRMKKVYGKKKSRLGVAMILGVAFVVSTISVSAATMETAEAYCQWNKATVVEIESNTSMPEYEVFIEQGDAEKIVTEQGTVQENSRSTKTINWSVNNNVKMVGSYFECEAEDTITVAISIAPSDTTVKIGIENTNGSKTYINGKNVVSHSFNIKTAGEYRFFIENTSGKSVTIEGSYIHL